MVNILFGENGQAGSLGNRAALANRLWLEAL